MFIVKETKKGDVDPNLFVIPNDYEIVDNFEDIMNNIKFY